MRKIEVRPEDRRLASLPSEDAPHSIGKGADLAAYYPKIANLIVSLTEERSQVRCYRVVTGKSSSIGMVAS